jgi:hemerythrin-like domain-containing protein
MADSVVPPAEQHQITQDFERVEHEETGEGIHEKYLTLAEKLEKELEDGHSL